MHASHRDIRITLTSQYDALSLPQFDDPEKDKVKDQGPEVDVYVPIYPSSQFRIQYACEAPAEDDDTRFYYFKLYIAGKCQVSWGCGAQDGWEGKTMFIPAESHSSDSGHESREKLGFSFPHTVEALPNDNNPTFEIRVYRARARKRQQRQYLVKDEREDAPVGLRTGAIGIFKQNDPRRFYCYALLDEISSPHVAFRYHCRSSETLRDLGITKSRQGKWTPASLQDAFHKPMADRLDCQSGDDASKAVAYAEKEQRSPSQPKVVRFEEDAILHSSSIAGHASVDISTIDAGKPSSID